MTTAHPGKIIDKIDEPLVLKRALRQTGHPRREEDEELVILLPPVTRLRSRPIWRCRRCARSRKPERRWVYRASAATSRQFSTVHRLRASREHWPLVEKGDVDEFMGHGRLRKMLCRTKWTQDIAPPRAAMPLKIKPGLPMKNQRGVLGGKKKGAANQGTYQTTEIYGSKPSDPKRGTTEYSTFRRGNRRIESTLIR